jgi:hypothetical protein
VPNVRLYLGNRLLCERSEFRYTNEYRRCSTVFFCERCGEIWAREIHPNVSHFWQAQALICPRHEIRDGVAGSFFGIYGEAHRAFVLNDWSRFPKELLLYELSIVKIPTPGP